jgi:hypothetical protein
MGERLEQVQPRVTGAIAEALEGKSESRKQKSEIRARSPIWFASISAF